MFIVYKSPEDAIYTIVKYVHIPRADHLVFLLSLPVIHWNTHILDFFFSDLISLDVLFKRLTITSTTNSAILVDLKYRVILSNYLIIGVKRGTNPKPRQSRYCNGTPNHMPTINGFRQTFSP